MNELNLMIDDGKKYYAGIWDKLAKAKSYVGPFIGKDNEESFELAAAWIKKHGPNMPNCTFCVNRK